MRTNRRLRAREPWPTFYLVSSLLLLLALGSAVILDLINSRKGERSYLFARRQQASIQAAQEPPSEKAPAEPQAGAEAEPVAKKPQPKEPAVKKPSVKAAEAPAGLVALIVDDMGDSPEFLDELIALGEPLTISVLPYSAYPDQTARTAHAGGLEVLLHLPLESLNNHGAMTAAEGLIPAVAEPREIVSSFEASLSRVPFAVGVNNHMGSRFTADESLMRPLLEAIRDRGLFFVDSRTTAQTVAYREALSLGVAAAERNVFLDADEDRSLIRSRLLELFQKARRDGRAVGICHPFPETLAVLKSTFRLLESYNLQAVPVSHLVHK